LNETEQRQEDTVLCRAIFPHSVTLRAYPSFYVSAIYDQVIRQLQRVLQSSVGLIRFDPSQPPHRNCTK